MSIRLSMSMSPIVSAKTATKRTQIIQIMKGKINLNDLNIPGIIMFYQELSYKFLCPGPE